MKSTTSQPVVVKLNFPFASRRRTNLWEQWLGRDKLFERMFLSSFLCHVQDHTPSFSCVWDSWIKLTMAWANNSSRIVEGYKGGRRGFRLLPQHPGMSRVCERVCASVWTLDFISFFWFSFILESWQGEFLTLTFCLLDTLDKGKKNLWKRNLYVNPVTEVWR